MTSLSQVLAVLAVVFVPTWSAAATDQPNVLLILADDLGYGDVSCYNDQAKVPTPHLDRLAREGIRLTDAHSPCTVCTPTRYGLLTGQMPFRIPRGGMVFTGVDGPSLIAPGRMTLASMLRDRGYATACVGKWHVGTTFFDAAGKPVRGGNVEALQKVDFSRAIQGGPTDHGFDQFFGTACCPTTDWLYAFVEQDRVPVPPTQMIDKSKLPKHPYAHDCRAGMIAQNFPMEEVDLVFLEKSREFLTQHVRNSPDKPFFLFHSTQAVHLPSFAAPQFQGKSQAGPHGDFIHELDFIVGQLLETLEQLGVAENTIVIFTSDNGPETTSVIHMRRDFKHDGARPWRGIKRDNWEGGHRVPFIVRWPKEIEAGTISDQLACHTDIMATLAAVVGTDLPDGAAEDSFNLLPLWQGQATAPIRPYLLHQAFGGKQTLAIRRGDWKYINHQGSGGNNYENNPGLKPFMLPETNPAAPGQLYNLASDPGETRNVYAEQPDLVEELSALLEESIDSGRSRPKKASDAPASGQVSTSITEKPDWKPAVETRLREIYERGEWHARRFEGEWLPDSSGYLVTEQKDGEQKRVFYGVDSGERDETKSIEPIDRMLSPDGKMRLEFRGRRLFVRDIASGARTQLTKHPADREVFYRQPNWSPDSKHVLFIESDETHVKQRSVLIPTDPSYPQVQEHRFARVGGRIEKLRIGVVDPAGTAIHWLPIESPEEGYYLGQVEWAGEKEVLVETLSRFRDKREFLLVNLENNQVRRIFSETNKAWVDASQGKNWGLIWINDGKQFIVISEKDGWRQAFLYSRDGQEIAKLTGDYDIIDRLGVDEQNEQGKKEGDLQPGGWFYFFASPDNATQKYLYRVPLSGKGPLERITPFDQPGTHDYLLSPDANWAFHTYSTINRPPMTELVKLPSHHRVRGLEENAELLEKIKTLNQSPVEILQLDIGDGVEMDAWLIKPHNFDPARKYPVFVYVYGEPHAQTVLDQWGTVHDQFHRTVADLGYLVISIDNRGTPAPKGAAWRRSVFGSLGPLSTEDQAAALKEFARTRPFVDLSRVAIWGWSGGGSNTLNALFRKPDLYHVGIAVVPKPQPHLYNAWFQEIFMRTREVNPDGYQKAAAINYAEGLKGKLLIITGSGETNTHIQIIEGLVDRLIELGKSFDYMVYPNRDHGLREGAGSVVHVRMLIIRYLMENLPPGPR